MMTHHGPHKAGASQQHYIRAAAAAHAPAPGAASQQAPAPTLIITAEGRVLTPDGLHSLGTCGTPEAAIDFCQQIGRDWILRHVQTCLDLAGAEEAQP